MADLIVELLAELLEPVFCWIIENNRIPKTVRYLIVAIPFLLLTLLFVHLTVCAEIWWEQLLMGVLVLTVLIGWIYLNRKIFRSE